MTSGAVSLVMIRSRELVLSEEETKMSTIRMSRIAMMLAALWRCGPCSLLAQTFTTLFLFGGSSGHPDGGLVAKEGDFSMSRKNSHQFVTTLVLVSIAALGLAASKAIPAFAASPGTFTTTGSMNVARQYHTAMLLANGEVLVVGGSNSGGGDAAGTAEPYNPTTGTWSFTGSPTAARVDHSAVRLQNGQVLVAGGLGSEACSFLSSAELYNPATGTFTVTGSMSTGRSSFVLVALKNGQVLAAGGSPCGTDDEFGLTSAELYNPATGTWTATGSMSGIEQNVAALLQNGDVLTLPAQNNPSLYNPSTGSWTAPASPPVLASYQALLLPSGDVFDGGSTGNSSLSWAIYNPSTNQWTTYSAPPCTSFCDGGAALLSTGNVLVAGGDTVIHTGGKRTNVKVNGVANLLNPSTLTWASTGSMTVPLIGGTVTVLSNGQVLFAGGTGNNSSDAGGVAVASAELYTP
jgi:hypothetical protein